MGFWFFMLISNLLIPFTMILWGKYFMKKAPDKSVGCLDTELLCL